MEKTINFLIKASELKETPRTGWVWAGVKNPETIAEHTFRLAVAAWFLAEEKKINILRAIKIALFHDICEVYAGDITPVLYYPSLCKDKEKRKKILMKWARLSQKEKEKIGVKKFKKEKEALLMLAKLLKPNLMNEIVYFWKEYEKGDSREGSFVQQLNRIETLLQSIEFFGTKDVIKRTNWWEWTNEIVSDPLLLKFLKIIQISFYNKPYSSTDKKFLKENESLKNILDFLSSIEKLKKTPRKGWVDRKIKNPETIAGFIFILTLMVWIFVEKKDSQLNEEKIIKMSLCHEFSKVYAEDETPYDSAIKGKSGREKTIIFKKWIRFSRKQKMKIFFENYKKEKKALEKAVSKLPFKLKKEILQLWDEFKDNSTAEARFLNQLHILANLIQALQYWQKDKKFPIKAFWEWAFEVADSETSFGILKQLKKNFHN